MAHNLLSKFTLRKQFEEMKNSTLIFTLTIGFLITLNINVNAKSMGKLVRYNQITDKEVVIESSKGVKILFTALHNNSIGVEYLGKNEQVQLQTGASILEQNHLQGSIYVEHLDGMFQITTTSDDGLLIKINTNNFGYTFVNKANNKEIVLEEELFDGLLEDEYRVCFIVDNREELKLVAQK